MCVGRRTTGSIFIHSGIKLRVEKLKLWTVSWNPERSETESKDPTVATQDNATGFDSFTSRSLSLPAFPSMSRFPEPLHSRLRSE
jgi:hypothetical protein